MYFDVFDLSSFNPLTTLVANDASDLSVWQAVLQLITDLSRTTPPLSSISPSFRGTPHIRSSASSQDSNDLRPDISQQVLIELNGRTYTDVLEFYTKYFENKTWSTQVDKIYQTLPQEVQPGEDEVWAWWKSSEEQHLGDVPSVYYRTKTQNVTGATSDRQVDIICKRRSAPTESHTFKDFLVVGELTKSQK